jgi:hypothetical protein
MYLHVEGSPTSFEKLEGHENGRYMVGAGLLFDLRQRMCAQNLHDIKPFCYPYKVQGIFQNFSHNFSTVSIAISLSVVCECVQRG